MQPMAVYSGHILATTLKDNILETENLVEILEVNFLVYILCLYTLAYIPVVQKCHKNCKTVPVTPIFNLSC